ncbi:hypothetical protein AVEN_72130-1 [Araneus ventricosus]|uniref:Uncharacterized protein n=1 Tax=Araneus ventricosus TaxID=182803 RepID=A0A4Y2MNZ9_ARAVE|nr:hypothetical protein AVEN_72130-1 [Araneus ventricosus]
MVQEPNTTILSQTYGANKISGINIEEYLTANADHMGFSGVTEENILSEITDETENDVEEDDDDTDPSQSLLTSKEALQSVQSLRTFFSNLSSTIDVYVRALDYANLVS